MGRQLHSHSVAPFVPRKRLPDRAFPGAVLPPRGRWMCCAGFPWAFALPSTAAAQGNQPMISELRAVTLVPGLEPNARNAGEKRLGQEYWSGLPFPSPGDLPDPGIEPSSPTLEADALPSELPGKPKQMTLTKALLSVSSGRPIPQYQAHRNCSPTTDGA